MFVKTMLETLAIAALIVALFFEDRFIQYEEQSNLVWFIRDCRAIRRACKRQGITARDMFRMVKQEARK